MSIAKSITNKSRLFMLGLACVAGLASTSNASVIATDTDSMPGFTGSEPFFDAQGGNILSAVVDYAVFAPGQYPGSAITGADPSGGTEYVYTYLVNNGSASTVELTSFSVGLATGSGAHNDGQNNSLGGTAPAFQSITSSSFQHLYSPGLAAGASSNITLFTSPNAPGFRAASVGNGGLSDQEVLPSPAVPEPTSLGFLAAAGLLAARRRRSMV